VRRCLLHIVTLAILAPTAPRACTTFCDAGDSTIVFGKNYDWEAEAGLLVVNQRGVQKTAATADNPARWTSRWGSVTFDQYGREFPNGGMNERGLVVELMWLDETEYPPPDARPALPTLQWIQYQLDMAATVEDVLASDHDVRITSGGSAHIHFLIADAGGDAAAVEWLDGARVVHRGRDLPYRALANHTYEASAAYRRRVGPVAGGAERAAGRGSLERFARAASGASSVAAGFALLADVAQGPYTKWSIVYDLGARRIHFRTRTSPAVRWLDLDDLRFDCGEPVRVAGLDAADGGDLAGRLHDYRYEENLALVQTAFSQTAFLREVPDAARVEHARLPERTTCGR